jgi:hypothetical protein
MKIDRDEWKAVSEGRLLDSIDGLVQLERELAEARKQRDKWADECEKNMALLKEAVELGELAMNQRDTLAEALREFIEEQCEHRPHDHSDALGNARTALAAMTGGTP